WQNGRGVTREIVRIPLDATLDTFDWRVSIAEVSASGPFSTFDGVDRIIALLDGDGMHLQSADGTIDHRLDSPLAPFAFRGEDAIDATLLAAPSRDFNVMVRRATHAARLSILRGWATVVESASGVLYAARGQWWIGHAGESHLLDSGAGLWW